MTTAILTKGNVVRDHDQRSLKSFDGTLHNPVEEYPQWGSYALPRGQTTPETPPFWRRSARAEFAPEQRAVCFFAREQHPPAKKKRFAQPPPKKCPGGNRGFARRFLDCFGVSRALWRRASSQRESGLKLVTKSEPGKTKTRLVPEPQTPLVDATSA